MARIGGQRDATAGLKALRVIWHHDRVSGEVHCSETDGSIYRLIDVRWLQGLGAGEGNGWPWLPPEIFKITPWIG